MSGDGGDDRSLRLPDVSGVDVESTLASIRHHVRALRGGEAVDVGVVARHGERVEERLSAMCKVKDDVTPAELLALRAAALLYGVGLSGAQTSLIPGERRHLAASLDVARRVLARVDVFASHDSLRLLVYYLVAHVCDTSYLFPDLRLGGAVVGVDLGSHAPDLARFQESLGAEQRSRLAFLGRLLREADALAGLDEDWPQRVLAESTARGLGMFGAGNPANAWCWEESAVGNVLLFAKRALLDACTADGEAEAIKGYRASENAVEALCQEHGRPFVRETFARFRGRSRGAAGTAPPTLVQYLPWDEVEAALRDVTLMVDRTQRPYADAKIELKRYAINDLHPIATYTLRPRLQQLEQLQFDLCDRYALSLFDLTGLIEYEVNGEQYRQAPPVVERYYEPVQNRELSVIVDGLHRVSLARRLRVREVWVAEISGVSERFPLVSLPLRWDKVRKVNAVPSDRAKRVFRYATVDEFPDVSGFSSTPVTPENYLYFFYRDLSVLGSHGIRRRTDSG